MANSPPRTSVAIYHLPSNACSWNNCQIFHYYVRFTFTNENGEDMDITFGSADDNEVLASGQSATQFPQEYRLETSTTIFHLIDTPGIGDCRGIEKDKENFDKILTFLTCYDKINAVVVLLKPTIPGCLWPSNFVFWSCLGTYTSHWNPTLYLPLLIPGERFTSQETPCQF